MIKFAKWQGVGNDFILLDHKTRLTPDLVRRMCDRKFGIGADQLLQIVKPKNKTADARMEIWNSDGSRAEMCGNGIRCVAAHLNQYGPRARKREYVIETLAGLNTVRIIKKGLVLVDMGPPVLGKGVSQWGEEIEVGGERLRFFEVSMGNPHAVIFVASVGAHPVERLGPLVENHPRFSARTNVEFVEIAAPGVLKVRVWERGAGITLGCGTGACASAVAAVASGRIKGDVAVQLPGGTLRISWKGDNAPVFMEGPAQEVFKGLFG